MRTAHPGTRRVPATDHKKVPATPFLIQVLEDAESIDLREIQVHPDHQGKQLGQTLIRDAIQRATASGKPLVLSTGLKNLRAKALYERLGFTVTGQSATHFHICFVGEEA
ncbi:MAG: GNAT family N-acetyltransferase [Planctomycetota bacterium]